MLGASPLPAFLPDHPTVASMERTGYPPRNCVSKRETLIRFVHISDDEYLKILMARKGGKGSKDEP